MNTERNTGVVELSEGMFREQVNTARDVLSTVYQTSQPLLMLGYNGAQIRALQGIYTEVEGGEAVDAIWNDNRYPFYKHHTTFENKYGRLGLSFSGNGDYLASGYLNEVVQQREHFPVGSHPFMFLLRKALGQDIALQQLSERIFRGKYTGEAGAMKKVVAKLGVSKGIPQVRDSYEAQWLDEDIRMDAVFYFPAQDDFEVFRKIKTNGGYEVWGRRQNINSQQIKQALGEKTSGRALVFQLAPAQIKA